MTVANAREIQLRPCVFFDRDGIVNRHPGPGYVERLEDFHLLPEFFDALRIVTERGFEAVIITNQRGVGLGRMSQATLDRIHDHLRDELRRHHLGLLDIVSCVAADPHHPLRKPNPGMFLDAAHRHRLDLAASWAIGDQERDIVAGHRAGCRTLLVRPGHETTIADFRLQSIEAMPDFLRKHL